MANYAVDSRRQPMTVTGIVEAVKEWEDKPGGGRRPSFPDHFRDIRGLTPASVFSCRTTASEAP